MRASPAIRVEDTRMFQEAAGASAAVRSQLRDDARAMAGIAAEVRRMAPRCVITCARGSSDHAATFAKYLIETRCGVVTASAAPSVSSLYRVSQDLRGCLFLAISQSGRSPDLLAAVDAAKQSGATVLALCNAADAPLCAAANWVIELRAGVETSVAATKSYLATLAALTRLVAAWTEDRELQSSIESLPDLMDRSWSLNWSPALASLESARNLFVIGRGLGLGAVQETALKFKETCGLHAEAFSSAEVQHGPYALLGAEFPALLFAQADATRTGVETLGLELARRAVPIVIAGALTASSTPLRDAGATVLPALEARPEMAPILLVQSAYRVIAELSVRRGYDPDRPAHLRKVTETV